MTEQHGGYGLPTPNDRLDSLRATPIGSTPPPSDEKKKLRPELLWVVGICSVLLMIGVTYGRGRLTGNSSGSIKQQLIQQIDEKLQEETGMSPEVLDGEVLFGVAVKPGNYPTELKVGDVVRVIATPSVSGTGESHEIEGRMTVMSINNSGEFGGETIITLSGPQASTMAIADSGPLHLTIVEVSAA